MDRACASEAQGQVFESPRAHHAHSIHLGTMDFIERLFGLSPDGGSGMLEALILCVVVGVIALLARKRGLGLK